jgi:hypothetical protein
MMSILTFHFLLPSLKTFTFANGVKSEGSAFSHRWSFRGFLKKMRGINNSIHRLPPSACRLPPFYCLRIVFFTALKVNTDLTLKLLIFK